MPLIQSAAPLTKQDGRQWPTIAEIRFDFTAGGLVVGANNHPSIFTVPAGGRVIGGEIIVDVAWVNAANAVTIDLGDGVSATRYLNGVDLMTAGRTALTLDGYRYAETDGIDGVVTPTVAAPSAGQAHIILHYMVEDRTHEIQE